MIYESLVLDANHASDASIRVPVPVAGRGRLYGAHVVQSAGTLSGFSVDVFSSEAACQPNYYDHLNEEQQADFESRNTPPPSPVPSSTPADDLFKVYPTFTAAAAATTAERREPNGMPYTNHDNSVRERIEYLYVEITPTSPDAAKQFDVRLVYEDADF